MRIMPYRLNIPGRHFGFLMVLAFFAAGSRLTAQCDRVAKVTAVLPGCGIMVTDLDNGQEMRVVKGTSVLLGGEVISYKSAPYPLPPTCPVDNYPVVEFTCLSSLLPCNAQFGYLMNAANPLSITLLGSVYDALAQNCNWDFGDGTFGSGSTVQHTYAQPGAYSVCLMVSDDFGCSASHCENIQIAVQNPPVCGFEAQVTAVGSQLVGKLKQTMPGYILQSVKWYTNQSNQTIAETSSFTAPLPAYGTYLVCASYESLNPANNDICATTDCRQLIVAEPGLCLNEPMMDELVNCPPVEVPVCGCDGNTYANECDAVSLGLSSWWAGNCGSVFGSCQADMDATVISGSLDTGFTVRFSNKCTGSYNFLQLDFGDGHDFYESTQWDTVLHHYAAGSIYRTAISVWKNESYVSNYTHLLATDAYSFNTENLPPATDYVLPGDANTDLKANVYDLLQVGVGYNTDGIPRPNASSAWMPQFGANWMQTVDSTVNFKHLDCDGNGSIHDFDVDVIEDHYEAIDSTEVAWLPEAPKVWVRFASDTITIDPANPMPLEIMADVVVGSPAQPALGLYGLAFALKYPEFIDHDPQTFYVNEFFGTDNHVLSIRKDDNARQQLDMGFVRKNHQTAGGYGVISKVAFRSDFIIIVDITDRAENNIMPLTIPVRGLRAIDADGKAKEFSVPVQQDTVWIKLLQSTKTKEADPNETVYVYPNPASDAAVVYTGKLETNRIEVFNALGQLVQTVRPSGQSMTQLNVKGWAQGVYTVHIWTVAGKAEKKLVVR